MKKNCTTVPQKTGGHVTAPSAVPTKPAPTARGQDGLSPLPSPGRKDGLSPLPPRLRQDGLSPLPPTGRQEDGLSPLPPLDRSLPSSPRLRPRVVVPKDSLQPKQGDLLSIHDLPGPAEEEEARDSFPVMPRFRAHTNPETIRQRRRAKCRLMNRPPTPPPGDLVYPPVMSPTHRNGRSTQNSRENLEHNSRENLARVDERGAEAP